VPANIHQDDLFGTVENKRDIATVFETIDRVNKKYGHRLIHIAASSRAIRLEDEERGRKLAIPYLGEAR
jgi:2-iminoacetate synthase ThiH